MLSLYRRKGIFYLYAVLNGQRRRWSLKTKNRRVALLLQRKAEIDLLSGGTLAEVLWPDFEEEFFSWITPRVQPSTKSSYQFVIDRFTAFLEKRVVLSLEDITPAVLSDFTAGKTNDGGIKFDLRVLRRVFSYAVECGYLKKNPVLGGNLNSTPGRTQPFAPNEIALMLAKCKRADLKAILLTFLHTGLRITDVANLQRENISAHAIIIRTRKRGKTVRIPLHPELAAALETQLKSHSSPLVFPGSHGSKDSLGRRLRRYWRSIGLVGAHPHRMRDTFSVELLKRGASLYDIAKLLGITVRTAELHYSPYTQELQMRAAQIMGEIKYCGSPEE